MVLFVLRFPSELPEHEAQHLWTDIAIQDVYDLNMGL